MDWQQGKKRLLNQLEEEIRSHFDEQEANHITDFSRQVHERASAEDNSHRQLADLYGATIGSWRFIQLLGSDEFKIRVFNPSYRQHGWQLGHTVVTLLSRNMPFITDSVRGELNRRNITIHSIQTTTFTVIRDSQGQLVELLPARSVMKPPKGCALSEEALIYFEIDRHSDENVMADMTKALHSILQEVAIVVDDFKAVGATAKTIIADVKATKLQKPAKRKEIEAFIDWLFGGHFMFLGYEKMVVDYTGDQVSVSRADPCYGLFRTRSSRGCVDLQHEILRAENKQQLLDHHVTFSKSSSRARVHRLVYPDYVCVKVFDEAGRVIEEHRLLGMYTSSVYTLSPTLIPLVRGKVAEVIDRSNLDPSSHIAKDLARVLEVFPRDELIQSSTNELFSIAMAVNQIQERRQVRLFVRHGHYGKFVNCLVYTPREIYHTDLRGKIESILCDAYGAKESEFTTFFSESILTRTHFVLRVDPGSVLEVNERLLEEEIIKVTMSWQDQLRNHLLEEFGEENGTAIHENYALAFTPGYMDDFDPRAAVDDIKKIQELKLDGDIAMNFYRRFNDAENHLCFRLFHRTSAVALSDVMPVLENLGLRVLGEHPYKVKSQFDGCVWVHEFRLEYGRLESVDIKVISAVFEEAFSRIWYGDAESDLFNRLIIGSGLAWRDIAMLRAFAKYMRQIQFNFSNDYIAETLSNHTAIVRLLVRLFYQRFDPAVNLSGDDRLLKVKSIEDEIFAALDTVDNLSEDRIIRQYVALINATLRTNFFQSDQQGSLKSYFSFKLLPDSIPDMPLPKPMFEIFVYSPRVEGVHLRGGKVARGGLRWSDRLEDFRTEVLGLVKAQQVKNAVIVPTGAKGGFVSKRPPVDNSREALQAEGIACYQIFIQALLDITDNLQEGEIIPPTDVVRLDDDDSYLVVAADKGTATFSDIANEISNRYGFWLGDAFASGGSVGYDHKKMGITARGAWVSVQQHFREIGINTQTTEFSVIGVGDMAGDVFGNGMLLSEHIALTAAFNHLHIFIDPSPETAPSFIERQRLFDLPRSSWADYNQALISKGGGVFKRSAKSIAISAEMKARFDIKENKLTPNELIVALLKAPIDLFWNGGIGTYIKSSRESHADVGDKANDSLRVDGKDLRFKVIGEGGNLGVTQLGRVEFNLNGGKSNTDFIDNAAGVDCSDHEVNIKILLNGVINSGDMTAKQRNALLEEMTESVGDLVLDNNYRQTGAISIAEREALKRNSEYRRLIQSMEASGKLNRELEFLPSDEVMVERWASGKGLTRPELSVLISYAKSQMKEALVDTDVPDNEYMARAVETAFPERLRTQYHDLIHGHRLRREIISTQVANDMVNSMGITFVDRISQSTGANFGDIAKAYVTARDVFSMADYWSMIEDLDYQVDSDVQIALMTKLTHLVRRSSRWFIRNRRSTLDPVQEISGFKGSVETLVNALPQLLVGKVQDDWQQQTTAFTEAGVPEPLARYIAGASEMYSLLGIIEAAGEIDVDVVKIGEVFFLLANKLEIDWFARQIADIKIDNHWQAMAREAFRDDLEWQMRALTISALRFMNASETAAEGVERWIDERSSLMERWRSMLCDLQGTESQDFAMYSVAIRELLDMAQRSKFDDA